MSQAVIRLMVIPLLGASFHVRAASDVTTAGIWSASSASSFSASARDHRLAGVRGSDDVLLRNADAIVGARLWLTPGSASPAFVYADVGATNSAVMWQGFAGVHRGDGIDLVGGWRRVTYHYAPGFGLDSLEFDGPFVGATLAL